MRLPFRFPLLIILTLTARVASAADDTDNFREDVFACEEAVAYLGACCPDFVPATARCVFDHHEDHGCDESTRYAENPAVSLDEAHCVLAKDCDSLRAAGVCDRAKRMQPERSITYTEMGSTKGTTTEGNTEALCQ